VESLCGISGDGGEEGGSTGYQEEKDYRCKREPKEIDTEQKGRSIRFYLHKVFLL